MLECNKMRCALDVVVRTNPHLSVSITLALPMPSLAGEMVTRSASLIP